jgi:hypothetical protein
VSLLLINRAQVLELSDTRNHHDGGDGCEHFYDGGPVSDGPRADGRVTE